MIRGSDFDRMVLLFRLIWVLVCLLTAGSYADQSPAIANQQQIMDEQKALGM
jgi:hypothetical protein